MVEKKAEAGRIRHERRSGTKNLVDKLTAERAEMLTLFCRVAGLDPFKDDAQRHAPEVLQEFCQVLVDYIAAGHFSLYERIVNGAERRRDTAKLAEKLYPRIAGTTEAVLAFNDKYDTEEQRDEAPQLDEDLSILGEELALRIELEDQLLKALLSPHTVEIKSDISLR